MDESPMVNAKGLAVISRPSLAPETRFPRQCNRRAASPSRRKVIVYVSGVVPIVE